MPHSLFAEEISFEDLKATLQRYDDHVPEALKVLDKLRFQDHPRMVAERVQDPNAICKDGQRKLMSKDELLQLVDWKLKHGTYRPKLRQLVESNDAEEVDKVMMKLSAQEGTAKEKMKIATSLRGIGPATASLVLSCIDPLKYPFFSDELYRWIHWDGKNVEGKNAGIKPGKGWARPIGYTQKEYDSLIARCQMVQERLSGNNQDLDFLDLEKVAYVLGKEQLDLDVEIPMATKKQEGEGEVGTKIGSKRLRKEVEPSAEARVKRFKSSDGTSSQPTRKSSRNL